MWGMRKVVKIVVMEMVEVFLCVKYCKESGLLVGLIVGDKVVDFLVSIVCIYLWRSIEIGLIDICKKIDCYLWKWV